MVADPDVGTADPVPDPNDPLLFPLLEDRHLDLIRGVASARRYRPGEVVFGHGVRDAPFVVLTDGRLDFYDCRPDGRHFINELLPGTFVGDLSIFTGDPTIAECVAGLPSCVLTVDRAGLRELTARHPDLGDLLLGTMTLRREWLEGRRFGQARLFGPRSSPEVFTVRDLLARNQIPLQWIDTEKDPEAARPLDGLGVSDDETPVLVQGATVLRRATAASVVERLGLRADVDGRLFDVAIVGGGPAGLAAAVYATSEGLSAVVLDAFAPGGQAGTSSRIENYLGFPTGLSGSELAQRAVLQAQRFGAVLSSAHRVCAVRTLWDDPESDVPSADPRFALDLSDGQSVLARSVIVATGARYRRLEAENAERFEGAGVYYVASHTEAVNCRGEAVVVVGGANSAGQAAMNLSRFASRVHLVVRRPDLTETMSRYLVERVLGDPSITVHTGSRIAEFRGDRGLRSVLLERAGDEPLEIATGAVFVLIGGTAPTEAVDGLVELDSGGFVLTGPRAERRLRDQGRPPRRAPFLLETSLPGMFAVGDVRCDSTKRVATAVGDGALAVRFVHELLP